MRRYRSEVWSPVRKVIMYYNNYQDDSQIDYRSGGGCHNIQCQSRGQCQQSCSQRCPEPCHMSCDKKEFFQCGTTFYDWKCKFEKQQCWVNNNKNQWNDQCSITDSKSDGLPRQKIDGLSSDISGIDSKDHNNEKKEEQFHALLESFISRQLAYELVLAANLPIALTYNRQSGPVSSDIVGSGFSSQVDTIVTTTLPDNVPISTVFYFGFNESVQWLVDALAAGASSFPDSRFLKPDIRIANVIGHTIWANERYDLVTADGVLAAQFTVQSQWRVDQCCRTVKRVNGQTVIVQFLLVPQ